MAIAPTGAIYKALEFDNVSSRTYGVYITGEAVYNAPARDVEMITIPGRSGAFALDNGRFENIEVSYPAGIFADTEADFRQAISDFRNFLCSRKGYVRLQDEYNPDEYRMAVYKSGLEVDPAMLKAGEFTITFDCKPQRWLTSGETKQTIASSGDTITNPTLFDASPLLEIDGYGTVEFNGYTVEIADTEYGKQILKDSYSERVISTSEVVIPDWLYKANDVITISGAKELAVLGTFSEGGHYPYAYYDSDVPTFTVSSGVTYDWYVGETAPQNKSSYCNFRISYPDISFPMGVAFSQELDASFSGVQRYNTDTTITRACEVHLGIIITYDGNKTIQIYIGWASVTPHTQYVSIIQGGKYSEFIQPEVSVMSTKRIVEQKIYLDCDLGEAYSVEDGVITSLNQYIDLGSDLPTLATGDTEFALDNTITELQVIPRWWKI